VSPVTSSTVETTPSLTGEAAVAASPTPGESNATSTGDGSSTVDSLAKAILTSTGDGISQLDESTENHSHWNSGTGAGSSSALVFTEPSSNAAADTRSNASSLDDFDFLGQLDDSYLLKLFDEDAQDGTGTQDDTGTQDGTPDNSSSHNSLPVPDLPEELTTSASRTYHSTLPVHDLPKLVCTKPATSSINYFIPSPVLTQQAVSSTLPVPDLPKEVAVRRNPGRAAKNNVSYKDEDEEEDEGYCEFNGATGRCVPYHVVSYNTYCHTIQCHTIHIVIQ